MNRFQKPLGAPVRPPSDDYGLVGWLEQTRVQLPLKGVECQFHVCGDLVSVELDQIFHQDAPAPFDCVYQFPLPARAAVHRCELHVNGRIIRARVESQPDAEEIVRRQKAAGHRTALVQAERDNLFTLSLGNLQPGDVVVVRFAYVEALGRLGDWSTLRIPFCPGIRYVPGTPLLRRLQGHGTIDDTDQVPDASRISPPRIDALHRDAAYVSIEGRIEDPSSRVTDLSSTSHSMAFRGGESQIRIRLAGNDDVPDRDFALRWTEQLPTTLTATAWGYQSSPGGLMHALVALAAPDSPPNAETAPRDYYFLVDQSSSMEGMKWEKAILAFRSFLNVIQPHDRVWLTLFNSTHRDFAEKPLTLVEWLENEDATRLASIGTGGGTELLPALGHVLNAQRRHSHERVASVILITDGEVGNEAAILNCTANFPNVRIHTFGIDTTVNDALLQSVAERHRGSCCLLQPTDDIAGAVSRVANRLRQPALLSIQAGADWEPAEDTCPDLHSGGRLTIALRAKADASGSLPASGRDVITLQATRPDGTKENLSVPLTRLPEPALGLVWARQRIAASLDDNNNAARVLALAKEYNLLCRGAAFVAWDEAERVTIARHEIVQPSANPFVAPSKIIIEPSPFFLIAEALPEDVRQSLLEPDPQKGYDFAPKPPPKKRRSPGDPGSNYTCAISLHDYTEKYLRGYAQSWAILRYHRADSTLIMDPEFKALCEEYCNFHIQRNPISIELSALSHLFYAMIAPLTPNDDDAARVVRWTHEFLDLSHPLRQRFLELAARHTPTRSPIPVRHEVTVDGTQPTQCP